MAVLRQGQYSTVTAVSQQFTNPMAPGIRYLFTASTDCYVKTAVTGGSAAAAANNVLYKAGMMLVLENPDVSGTTNAFVHFIEVSADGVATLVAIEGDG